MSKILVVEPYKILQRAIAVSFFPEHQVEVTEQVPEVSALEQRAYDVAIVDAVSAARKECGRRSEPLFAGLVDTHNLAGGEYSNGRAGTRQIGGFT